MRPSEIGRLNVIGLPLPLRGDPTNSFRRFVVLQHFPLDLYVAVLAPVFSTKRYNDPDLARGCVLFGAKQAVGFGVEIGLEPLRTHRHPITYSALQQSMDRGTFKDYGPLPADFPGRFLFAIEHNIALNKLEKEGWSSLVT